MLAVNIMEQDYLLNLSVSHQPPVEVNPLKIRQDLRTASVQRPPQLKIRSDLTAASSPSPPSSSSPFSRVGGGGGTQADKWSLSGPDLGRLILPYLHADTAGRKICCTVCGMKFTHLVKGLNHIENKHLDCLQYKCFLCKSIKNSRLAFDCHMRRRHSMDDRTPVIAPLLRLKHPFTIKAERLTKSKGGRGRGGAASQQQQNSSQRSSSYDLQFVTFLRSELGGGGGGGGGEAEPERPGKGKVVTTVTSWHWPTPSQNPAQLAVWLHKEQGIFRINCREEFAKKWYQLKEDKEGSWKRLLTEVLTIFIEKHIFKSLSPDLPIYQVFCIRQLLK